MGITALATFAAEITGGSAMSCAISYEASQSTLKINKDNSLVLQSVEVFFVVDEFTCIIFHNQNILFPAP